MLAGFPERNSCVIELTPLLMISNELGQNKTQFHDGEANVSCGELGLELSGQEKNVDRRSEHVKQNALDKGDECPVQDMESPLGQHVANNLPSVVLVSDSIPALSPIVVCQARLKSFALSASTLGCFQYATLTYTPNCAKKQGGIDAPAGNSDQTRPSRKMTDVDGRQYAPKAIDLRVVFVDLGSNKEHAAQEDGGPKPADERVGLHVQFEEAPSIEHGAQNLTREGVELWQEGRDGF